ncbi:ester cyclase [Ktedonobacter racemifer]|uniref:SnoaL-like domain-containing protein n=1 Tax=Ktedonobacter racemifer DSM 44963 TaxID=485913 RepID=D6U0Z6_KTERA|nr:nuclear transport factor 2 family protein [Ktedonobacter racemifer]EFH82486.1 protein of unknown function DUF1486 [Ktedonobacter racemifer DSM 44963]
MSVAENKKKVLALYKAFNERDLAEIEQVFAESFVDHSTPEQAVGPEGVRTYFAMLYDAIPDLRITIDDLVAEGDRVVIRTSWRGTYAESKEAVYRSMIQIFHVGQGKIQGEWNEGGDLLPKD